jgi:hypothetical protein
MDVSLDQWLALLRAHAAYRARYYGEVAPRIRGLEQQMGLLIAPSPDTRLEDLLPQLEATMKDRSGLFSEIERLDIALFGSVVPLLSEHQQQELLRIRHRRERDRLRGEAMLQGEGIAVIDVSAPARTLMRDEPLKTWSPDIELTLSAYEERLTALERKLHRASERVYEELVRGLLAAGISTATRQEEDERATAAMAQEVWLATTQPARQVLSKIHALNRRLFADLEITEPTLARRLRHAYGRAVCDDTSFHQLLNLVEGWDEALLARKGITPEERAAVEAELAFWTSSTEHLVAEILKGLQELWEKDNLVGARGAGEELCAEKYAIAARHYDGFLRFLTSLLGDRAEDLVARRRPWAAIPGLDSPSLDATVGRWNREVRRIALPRLSDHVKPISVTEVRRLATQLAWGRDQLKELNTLHASYASAFDAELSRQTDIVHATYVGPLTAPDWIQTMAERRAGVMPALDAVDRQLWNSVVTLNAAQDSRRIQLARSLRHRELLRSSVWHDSSDVLQEWRVDLVRLLDSIAMSTALRSAIESCLTEYDNEATAIARRQDSAALRLLEATDAGSVDPPPRHNESAFRGAQQALSAAYSSGIELNQSTLERLAGLLPPDIHVRIVAEYRRRAYAQLFNDPHDMRPLLLKAMILEGVDEATRESLVEAHRDYLAEYDVLSEAILRQLSVLEGTPFIQTEPALLPWYRGELNRFSFHRYDLNASMEMLLQSLLAPEQLAEIGGRPGALSFR